MKLNCDLGEGLDDVDCQVMPLIDMANIACGGHAGDDTSIKRCIELALEHQVLIGAHPSYPDRAHFGRVVKFMRGEPLTKALSGQLQRLQAFCNEAGTQIAYVKPHGALYHDILQDTALFKQLLDVMQMFSPTAMLMIQSVLNPKPWQVLAKEQGIELLFEAFADRAYTDEGGLVSRSQANAVHQRLEDITRQAQNFIEKSGVFSEHNQWLHLPADSLCVHGDTPLAYSALCAIHQQYCQ